MSLAVSRSHPWSVKFPKSPIICEGVQGTVYRFCSAETASKDKRAETKEEPLDFDLSSP